MAEKTKATDVKDAKDSNSSTKPETPKGATKNLVWKSKGKSLSYGATSDWMILRKKEKPIAEMFYTYYKAKSSKKRPITFVFNGGPGAASAYLHIGGLGPLRALFESDGNLKAPPTQLVNNQESWLEFTDLVFIDPIGTGFSRVIEAEEPKGDKKEDPKKLVDEKEFYQINRDLDSLGEFIEKFLSKNKLWDANVYLAGESYGGYRTAKLARRLQERHGIGLTAVIAISPALEWSLLNSHDYDVLHFVDSFCTMALTAVHHGKSKAIRSGTDIETARKKIEVFATKEYAMALVSGDTLSEKEQHAIFKKAADFIGLEPGYVIQAMGRVRFWQFARMLLKDERKIVGFYDSTITAVDPFADRDMHEAPDPTLTSIERVFTSGINQMLRSHIGIETDRRYTLLSEEVNMAWKRDDQKHVFDMVVGSVDDLRFAMSMNQHMKVLITHGYYDMVTPYFSSERLGAQMRLLPDQRSNLSIKHFGGGHMFYTWDDSRKAFRDWVKTVYV